MDTAMAAAGREEADAPSSSPLDLRHAPLLLFDGHGDGGEGKAADGDGMFVLYSIPSRQVLRRRVGEMEDHRYWTTPQGWVLMAARGGVTFLWDPFTGARISLPPDREGFLGGGGGGDDESSKRCLLSCKSPVARHHHPGRSCLVLVVDLADTVLWYCRLGVVGAGDEEDVDRQWLKHEYGGTVDGVSRLGWSLTSVGENQFLMDLDRKAKVVTLEFSPEPRFTVIPVKAADKDSWAPHNGTARDAWVESLGCLFRVRFRYSDHSLGNRSVVSVEVSKLDLSARAWAKVGTLDGRAFVLVHPQFGASLDPHEAGSGGLKGDCIYYCMPDDDDALHVYDIERGTTSLRNPGSPHHLGAQHSSTTKVLMPTTVLC